MRIIQRAFFVIGFFMLCNSPIIAGDYGFEKTENGIFKALTTPKKAPLFNLRGVGAHAPVPSIKVRGLTVVPADPSQTKVIEKMVPMPSKHSGETVNLEILFSVNSYIIQPKSMPILDNLGAALRRLQLRSRVISINGHTDSDGSEQHNLQLSLKRAVAVKQYLALNHGVRNARLKVMGYGEGMPIIKNTSARNKRLNRRVEISVISQ
ncbi:OmpA family protein [Alphaproteobacteria bacterium]|nr:OmpA family protein [Alphaproteobacteria bacterium]